MLLRHTDNTKRMRGPVRLSPGPSRPSAWPRCRGRRRGARLLSCAERRSHHESGQTPGRCESQGPRTRDFLQVSTGSQFPPARPIRPGALRSSWASSSTQEGHGPRRGGVRQIAGCSPGATPTSRRRSRRSASGTRARWLPRPHPRTESCPRGAHAGDRQTIEELRP